jgi:hypothetical protein
VHVFAIVAWPPLSGLIYQVNELDPLEPPQAARVAPKVTIAALSPTARLGFLALRLRIKSRPQ